MGKFYGHIVDTSNIVAYPLVFERAETKTININQPFKILQCSISSFQSENPVLCTISIDDKPLATYYAYMGTTGEQYKNTPVGEGSFSTTIEGEVENPIYVNVLVGLLPPNYNELVE